MKVFYCPIAHSYEINGTVVPSVTQALTQAGHIDTRWYAKNDRALARGRAVHAAAMAVDQRVFPTLDLPPDVGGPLDAYRAFVRDKAPVWEYVERAFYHRTLRYGGRPDRVFRTLRGVDGPGTLELKTGGPAAWHGLQTAGYVRLRPRGSRWILYLGDDGRYRLVLCRDQADHGSFLAALQETWRRWPITT